ncbi:hypothetical protein AVEN_227174-1 [Araneus ventricosus]|uniref:Uncharacterized protein n=1 Tax=Araneus ventricosus TaxID=182803 RepID=A0A4Y2BWW1_ARAVE|nr:hypothetical protein AVEN_227174-1 [Araneus ventricosus]
MSTSTEPEHYSPNFQAGVLFTKLPSRNSLHQTSKPGHYSPNFQAVAEGGGLTSTTTTFLYYTNIANPKGQTVGRGPMGKKTISLERGRTRSGEFPNAYKEKEFLEQHKI